MAFEPVVVGAFVAVFVGIYVLMLTDKIHKTVAALVGAVGIVALGIFFDVFHYDAVAGFLDLDVVGLLFGTFIISRVAEETGVFEFVSIKFLKASRGEPFRLFLFFSLLIIIVSSILSNLVAMVLVSSLTIVACKNLGLDPKPYILAETIFANLGGLLTLVSSVPNILVGVAAGIGFVEFLVTTLPLTLILTGVTFFLLVHLLGIKTSQSPEEKRSFKRRVDAFDEWSVVKDRRAFYAAVIVVTAVLLLFAVGDMLGVGLEFIAIAGAVVLLVLTRVDVERTFRELDWSIIFFVASLLIVVKGVSLVGVLDAPASVLEGVATNNFLGAVLAVLWIVGTLSSVVVDIPLTAAFIPIIQEIASVVAGNPRLLWWAVILGLGLGANFTPIGSSSTIIGLSVLRHQDQPVSFAEFTQIGVKVCTVQLIVVSIYLAALQLAG
jgi:Na+/H+ antiporter NhaD/arsenite permease-like protein